ncbi:MAG: tRNA uridine-5-carboxymethylaminomethyl(34) synthesis GTPase MnmE [Opitutae bacterium]|nr:tRNA uridine-5-carboxymethylaminomethyl(34) synthesis GTPase MnmE [Opitutae bacterium]MBC9889527.1 tRNA uridine-5-carboxymethylaminomethyl(34) synthesis GTPase MnmE [Opitutae bacterium]
MAKQDTFVALSTPHGESALGLIRCSGNACRELVENIFGIPAPVPRFAYYRDFINLRGDFLDSVVFTFFEKDRSYTGDPMLEISCHGNPFILQRILGDLLERGCRQAAPGEFTQTAFLNGKMDLSQAEAVIDLIRARTDLAFKAAAQQLQGSLKRRIDDLTNRLLQIMAEVEAYIDFPEEDLPSEEDHTPEKQLIDMLLEIGDLADTSRTGIFLREGVKAAIIGPTNVGKSSILNRLLGESRVIVSETPGTTRDYVEASFFIEPYRIRILDTAGLRDTDDPIEKAGIAKTVEQMSSCDLVLLTMDASQPPPQFPHWITDLLSEKNTLIILNKNDLQIYPSTHTGWPGFRSVSTSALTGDGIGRLKSTLLEMVGDPKVSTKGDVVAVSARHHEALEGASEQLNQARRLLSKSEPAELVASHLRDGLGHLEAIVGKVDNERVLDKLFASFCIGK